MEIFDLKSPVFQPKPGWGGKLANWLSKNFTRLLPLAVIIVVLVIFDFISSNYTAPVKPTGKETESANQSNQAIIEKTADKGQGIAHLAREALEDYLKENSNIDLLPAQKVFVETYFIKLNEYRNIKMGEKIIFQKDDLAEAVKKARSLTPGQMEKWMRYVRAININDEI